MARNRLSRIIHYCAAARIKRRCSSEMRGVILAYHRIAALPCNNHPLSHVIVEPSMFEKQISYLKNKYRVVSLNEFTRLFTESAFNNCVVITFDDGYEDIYNHAFPVLKKYRLPATVFLPTAYVDTQRTFWWDRLSHMLVHAGNKKLRFTHNNHEFSYNIETQKLKRKAFFALSPIFKKGDEAGNKKMLDLLSSKLEVNFDSIGHRNLTWKQIREMAKHNIDFGTHTKTHCVLSHLDDVRLNDELSIPKKILQSRLKQEISAFAYPYGARGDFNEKSRNAIIRTGYKTALTMTNEPVQLSSDIYALPRIAIGHGKKTRFKLKMRVNL